MRLWLITSKLTYARAIVAASTADKARALRPDDAIWRDGQWMKAQKTGSGWHADMMVMRAPVLDYWPTRIEDVEVLELGRAENFVAEGVWCNEPSTEVRQ